MGTCFLGGGPRDGYYLKGKGVQAADLDPGQAW